MCYVYYFDVGFYVCLFCSFVERCGVVCWEGCIFGIECDGQSGLILVLMFDDGFCLEVDLFVDCIGFCGLLIGDELGVVYEDWRQWFFCDCVIVLLIVRGEIMLFFMCVMVWEVGW